MRFNRRKLLRIFKSAERPVFHDGQATESVSIEELVSNKVEAPGLIRPGPRFCVVAGLPVLWSDAQADSVEHGTASNNLLHSERFFFMQNFLLQGKFCRRPILLLATFLQSRSNSNGSIAPWLQ